MNRALSFYSGASGDHRGRMLAEMHQWSDEELEDIHDFIQWWFPLPEPSPVNPEAPILDAETIDTFEHQTALRASLERMLRFYGLDLGDGPVVRRAENFEDRAWVWLREHNHNHLRITRILRCCSLLGLRAEAQAFLLCLEQIAEERPGRVNAVTLRFWRDAVR